MLGVSRKRILVTRALLALGLLLLVSVVMLLRFSAATQHLYAFAVKDPPRRPPEGKVLVAPADGTVLYVRRVLEGQFEGVVKQGVSVPVLAHLKLEQAPLENGYLIGIYMPTNGVHINRAPDDSQVKARHIFNGPHLDMTGMEREVILRQLVPGVITLRKLAGLHPFEIEKKGDHISKSARETLVLDHPSLKEMYVVRIADYYVGKILTWVEPEQRLERGQKLGMITWGSQTDLLFADQPGLRVKVKAGDRVLAGETVLATY